MRKIHGSARMWGQVPNSLTLIITSSPSSTVFALWIAKTCLRLAPRYASEVVFIFCGHELLSIILHSVQILLSTLDPGSTIFSPRKGLNICLRLAQRCESKAVCFLKGKSEAGAVAFTFYLCAPSRNRTYIKSLEVSCSIH